MALDFRERAAKLGHSLDQLDAGIPVVTTTTINNIDDLKSLLMMWDMPSRQGEGILLFEGIPLPPSADQTYEAILRRVNEFIFNGGILSESDRQTIAVAFPMQVGTSSYPDFTPDKPVIYNTQPFKPEIINAGTLTLNQGIYISAYQTPLTIFCDNFVRNGTSGVKGDINILGATGTTGIVGYQPGQAGGGGQDGSGNGIQGQPGATGGTGGNGNPGQPSMPAKITITTAISGTNPKITIYTCSGTGGNGGTGGTGGQGGVGGPGRNATYWGCDCHNNGGNAGMGGVGGNGGKGGDGVPGINAAGNITVFIPSNTYKDNIIPVKTEAPGGGAGAGGAKAGGGPPGSAGASCKNCSGGNGNVSGPPGSTGGTGNASTVKGKYADIIINPLH